MRRTATRHEMGPDTFLSWSQNFLEPRESKRGGSICPVGVCRFYDWFTQVGIRYMF